MTGQNGEFYVFTEGIYRRLGDGSDNMSVGSMGSIQTSDGGGSVTMSIADSSVGSNNNSRTIMLMHPDLKSRPANLSATGGHSVVLNKIAAHKLSGDMLTGALMDDRNPTEGLAGYENWTIDLQRLSMGPAFAQGAFGRLYKGTYNGDDVAIKILERPENNKEIAHLMEQQFAQEVMMLATLRHQNVVRFIGACRKPLVWCIVTEYATGGSLRMFLVKRQNRSVPLKLTVRQALDVARGMAYLHSLNFIHRDLKTDNLLIATDRSIKIADFGVARIEVQNEDMTPETGSYRWMAPEMIQHRPYNHKVDVYSFGIVLWELITGNLPFQHMTAVQAAFSVVNKGVRPIIPPDCPPTLAYIMSCCWDACPDERPSFFQIVELLEQAQAELMTRVGKARFRCGCLTSPLAYD